jgi:hypothetical protein
LCNQRTRMATGMRRGELLALRLCDVDFDATSVRVERSLEETAEGLRFKSPKSSMAGARFHCRLVQLPFCVRIGAGSWSYGWCSGLGSPTRIL